MWRGKSYHFSGGTTINIGEKLNQTFVGQIMAELHAWPTQFSTPPKKSLLPSYSPLRHLPVIVFTPPQKEPVTLLLSSTCNRFHPAPKRARYPLTLLYGIYLQSFSPRPKKSLLPSYSPLQGNGLFLGRGENDCR